MEGRTGDDASLVDRLRRGDPRAFEDLVIAYQHRVFGVALRMLGNRAEAEELAQERRIVVVLRDLEGLSYEEIATALELELGTVRSRLHRARMDLREKLERFLP